jgi:ABC-type antimicrobial peptide transport system permease subunit
LQDSIFQGELLLAESQFLKLDPDAQGYGMLLAEAPPNQTDALKSILETAYADRGLVASPAVDRLRSYLAVENTYLSTFQVLGGFGLLLGVLGLAVVMLRAAAERRGELALLRAMGFRAAAIGRMVLAENAVLIAAGLAIGVVAAMVSIAPPLIAGEPAGGDLLRTAAFLALVCAAAVGVCWWVTRRSLRAAIVPALRGE